DLDAGRAAAAGQDDPVAGHGQPLRALRQPALVDGEQAAVEDAFGAPAEAEHAVEAELVADEAADAGRPAPAGDHGADPHLDPDGAAADHQQAAAEEDREQDDEEREEAD